MSVSQLALFCVSLAFAVASVVNGQCDVATPPFDSVAKQAIIDKHNQLRAVEIASGAVGMFVMNWDDDLAARAQAWVNHLVATSSFDHGYTTLCNGTSTGQNLAMGGFDVPGATDYWCTEKGNFNYAANTCAAGTMCGHYTQVVWAGSYLVGCGLATDSSGSNIIACNYYPPGNMYISGAAQLPYAMGSNDANACKAAIAYFDNRAPGVGVYVNANSFCDFCDTSSVSNCVA